MGDEILEVDGTACQSMLEEEVTALLAANEGTVAIVVQFSYDYKRTLSHRRKVDLQSKLFVLSRRLLDLERQERHLQRTIDRREGLDVADTSDSGSVSSSSGAFPLLRTCRGAHGFFVVCCRRHGDVSPRLWPFSFSFSFFLFLPPPPQAVPSA